MAFRTDHEAESVPLNSAAFERLGRIRVNFLSARNTPGGGALLPELFEICGALRNGANPNDLKELIADAKLLQKHSYESRTRIWRALSYRYFEQDFDWPSRTLMNATVRGPDSREFVSLAYLYFAIRDRLTFEFVTSCVWKKWQERTTTIDRGDFLSFLESLRDQYPIASKWSEETRKKLARNSLSALRDFGLLTGSRKKLIQRPNISPETAFHLLCILTAEGLKGRAVLDAPDWRLFLWSDSDVATALGELAQLRWIRFERSGRTVSLELIRMPEPSS